MSKKYMKNKVGHVLPFKQKGTKVGKTLITLPAFIYDLESKDFSRDFSEYEVQEGLIDSVKLYLKENHPREVRCSFGDFDVRKMLSNFVSNYIISKNIIETYKTSLGKL